MSLVFCDGFHIKLGEGSVMPAGIWTSLAKDTNGTIGNSTSVKRTGSASFQTTKTNNAGSAYLSLSLSPFLTELFIGFAFQVAAGTAAGAHSSRVPILSLLNNSGVTLLTVGFNTTSSTIDVLRGRADNGTLLANGSVALSRDTWYYLEFKIVLNDTSGVVETKVNGNPDITFAGNSTGSTGGAAALRLGMIGQSVGNTSGTGTYYFDDFVLFDTGGTWANSWPGQPTVHWVAPDGPGEYDQWELTGAATAWEALDDWAATLGEADDATTRISSAEEGDRTSVTLSDLPVSGTILGLQVLTRAANELPGADTIEAFVRLDDDDYVADTWIAGTAYNTRRTVIHQSPLTAQPWTRAEINGLELGYRVIEEE